MGYSTDFSGQFKLDRKLDDNLLNYLRLFCDTRRMVRNPTKPPSEELWCPHQTWGKDGEFYVYGTGLAGQGNDADVVDHNRSPKNQPGLWCKWTPSVDGTAIEWSGAEKFYEYVEWLEYIIYNFLAPAGHVLNGDVSWQGEEQGDTGILRVVNNEVSQLEGAGAVKHLWEVEHDYYCTEHNYFNNDCVSEYDSWTDFFEAEGGNDLDYNLLFRWDWKPKNVEDEVEHDKLCMFWMTQRKGYNRCSIISPIDREYEGEVRKFLQERLAHLIKLWEPL